MLTERTLRHCEVVNMLCRQKMGFVVYIGHNCCWSRFYVYFYSFIHFIHCASSHKMSASAQGYREIDSPTDNSLGRNFCRLCFRLHYTSSRLCVTVSTAILNMFSHSVFMRRNLECSAEVCVREESCMNWWQALPSVVQIRRAFNAKHYCIVHFVPCPLHSQTAWQGGMIFTYF